MLKKSLPFCLLPLLAGCASTNTTPPNFVAAQPQVVAPVPEVAPAQNNQGAYLSHETNPVLQQAFSQYIQTGKAPNITRHGFQQFAYSDTAQPIINTAPFEETVITLQKGEKFTSISSGDPSRWSYVVATSGSGSSEQQNILVKPSQNNISTNMVITTNRRVYNLRLVATKKAPVTRSVRFWYPHDLLHTVNQSIAAENAKSSLKIAETPLLHLSHLNFNYDISHPWFGNSPSFMPVRVFDDGSHTFIQFPGTLAHRDLPSLFVVTQSQKALVNYQVKWPYFVVDRIFKQAILVTGVGHNQQEVKITNERYS